MPHGSAQNQPTGRGGSSDDELTRVPTAPQQPEDTPVPETAVPDAERTTLGDIDVTRLGHAQKPPADPDVTHIGGGDVTFLPVSADAEGPTVFGPPPEVEITSYQTLGPPRPQIARPSTTAVGQAGRAPRRSTLVQSTNPADGPLASGQAFGSRYHIIKVLGVGGMGAVYQAFDAELSVAVALKVIRPEIALDPVAADEIERRFKRELLLARQVTHPNIIRIHDLGDVEGIKYITMPFIDGADLATILKREQKLPVPRALRIARGVVAGLVAAHDAGVVHRDLKPANIMIGPEDVPTVMDFGIARSAGGPAQGAVPSAVTLSAADISRTAALAASSTMAGAIVGTVAYMAPEQARGEMVDQRADVYAFGLILYDMLTGGRRSKHAESAVAELHKRMEQAPPPPRSIDAQIPATVDAIIRRCLEPDAAKRFQTTRELQEALQRLDEGGKPLPIYRRVSRAAMLAAAAVVILLLGGTFYTAQWLTAPVKQPDPVSVVIADIENSTGDSAFDHTLAPTLRRALEDAGFINAAERATVNSKFGVRPPDRLDEAAARELALKQGLNVVLAGSIGRRGNGYSISLRALQPVTGQEITAVSGRAPNREQVLETATELVTSVRRALGDRTSGSAQLFAMRKISSTSLEAVQHYAMAMEALSFGRLEEAQKGFSKTVELDPNFGLGYQALASVSRNLRRNEDADRYMKEALRLSDAMTDREKFATRSLYYYLTGDYQQCVVESGQLISQYGADGGGFNMRALCLSKLRNMRDAVAEQQRAVKILPNRLVWRGNLAIYAAYSSDFQMAEREATAAETPTDLMTLALAFAKAGQELLPEAVEVYQTLAKVSARGASWSVSGLADLALYQGRFGDAARIFEEGAASDLATKNRDRAARKFTSLAYAELLRNDTRAALAAAEKALEHSNSMEVRLLAARIFVEANQPARAQKLAASLAAELAAEPRAYAKIIEGELALKSGDARQAIKLLTEANEVLDTWLGRYGLGRAYLQIGAFPQADSEFDRCITRRGEALALFADEEPTYGYYPGVYYYQGRVREGLQNAGSTDSYREYLKIRGQSTEDPLVRELRQKIGN